MNGFVSFSKPPPEASDANATSSTTTRPLRSLGFGSLRGEAKASSARSIGQRGVASRSMSEKLPIDFDAAGLVTVVVQDHLTGDVRMVAHATVEAVRKTLETGKATFWSRSRGELWEKGQTSGNALAVRRVLVDCDADCLIYEVEPHGPTCHTGAPSCFFQVLTPTARLAQRAEQ